MLLRGFISIFFLDRTFCSFSIFENGFGQDKLEQLFFVLGVYSIYNPSIGYCQGSILNDFDKMNLINCFLLQGCLLLLVCLF